MKKTSFLNTQIERMIAIFLMDVIAIISSSAIALFIRFDFSFARIPIEYWEKVEYLIPFSVIGTVACFFVFKLYKSVWRYASATELINTVYATTLAAILHVLVCIVTNHHMPRSYYFLYWLLIMGITVAIRFSYRLLRLVSHRREQFSKPKRNVLIVGAGASANLIIKEIESSQYLQLSVKCLVDDNPGCHGKFLRGVPIIGDRYKIVDAVEEYCIDEIIIAIPSASAEVKKELLDICKETRCHIRLLPGMYQLLNGDVAIAKLKEVEIEDLLGREPIHINTEEVLNFVKGKTVLVTGGGGSIGSELCRQIASHNPERLIIVDIYENNAYEIQQELLRKYANLQLDVLIASVRSYSRMEKIFEAYKPDIIYHAAAHKHVPLMEVSPNEAIKNNVMGTYNVARLADKYHADKFVLISTDKAVNPTNVMGASKRMCEMVVQMMNDSSETNFVAVRFGNVLGSNGSVIPLFKKQIAEGGPVTVTDPEIIRYFMTIPEAVSLVLQAGVYARGGEIFVLDMGKPMKILDLATNLIKLSGYKPYEDIDIQFTGLRPGEKMYEELLMGEEGLKKTANEMIYIGKPIDFSREEFRCQLKKIAQYAESEGTEIRDLIQQIVPTYQEAK